MDAVRTLVGLVALVAVFCVALVVGLRVTGTWEPSAERHAPKLKPEAWRTHRFDGLSIALPRSWKAVATTASSRRALAVLRKEHPRLAPLFRETLLLDRAVRFRAFDISGTAGARRGQFVTNLSVRTERVAGTARATWQRDLTALRQTPGLDGLHRARVKTPVGKAISIRYRFSLPRVQAAPLVFEVTQLSVVSGKKHYVVTYTTTESQARAYAPTFRRSGRSLRRVSPS